MSVSRGTPTGEEVKTLWMKTTDITGTGGGAGSFRHQIDATEDRWIVGYNLHTAGSDDPANSFGFDFRWWLGENDDPNVADGSAVDNLDMVFSGEMMNLNDAVNGIGFSDRAQMGPFIFPKEDWIEWNEGVTLQAQTYETLGNVSLALGYQIYYIERE